MGLYPCGKTLIKVYEGRKFPASILIILSKNIALRTVLIALFPTVFIFVCFIVNFPTSDEIIREQGW